MPDTPLSLSLIFITFGVFRKLLPSVPDQEKAPREEGGHGVPVEECWWNQHFAIVHLITILIIRACGIVWDGYPPGIIRATKIFSPVWQTARNRALTGWWRGGWGWGWQGWPRPPCPHYTQRDLGYRRIIGLHKYIRERSYHRCQNILTSQSWTEVPGIRISLHVHLQIQTQIQIQIQIQTQIQTQTQLRTWKNQSVTRATK